MPVKVMYSSLEQNVMPVKGNVYFANRTAALTDAANDEPCLETSFEGWKFAEDTQYYFHNGTNGILKLIISSRADEKENCDNDAVVMLMPGEAFQEKEWNRNFQVITQDGKRCQAKGKINQNTDARYRYFYYVNAESALKVVKGEMKVGQAWSRWRPLELMSEA